MANAFPESFRIVVNGEDRETRAATLDALLAELALDPERVAVELDRRIVRRSRWPETPLRAGARLEIVQFVGGG
jgi:thiamine biosynthesis protein ThiS